jgi:uncharacterized protein with ParB-like and HNH nuclease domain
MEAREHSISQILTEQIIYQIPAYQRPYSWGTDEAQELLDDIWNAYERKDNEYFMGSIITVKEEKNEPYEVVDGQQRLTTLNLIFAALRDCIADVAAKVEIEKRIYPKNALISSEGKPRLILRKSDQEFFLNHILKGSALTPKKLDAPKEKLKENLETIKSFLMKDKSDKDRMLFANHLLEKVYVVLVTTDSHASAHRLFNVLNARGVQLSSADLIKNQLFCRLEDVDQDSEALEEKWLELEGEIGISELDQFLGQYRTTQTHEKASRSLDKEFEDIIKKASHGPIKFVDTLIDSAKIYSQIKSAQFDQPLSLRSARSLNRVGFDEWIATLMVFLINKNNSIYAEHEAEFIELLEKITYQNWIRRLGRTARLTVYHQLIKAINENKSFEELKDIFMVNSNNQEFKQLLGGDVYGKPFAQALLIRLDEAGEDISVTRDYKGKLSIEHVLPQALKDKYWTDKFTAECHQQHLNKIGNLAMLSGSKNSRAQCYGFDEKKKIYSDRQSAVSFVLTKEIIEVEEWNEDAIINRQERLISIAEDLLAIN